MERETEGERQPYRQPHNYLAPREVHRSCLGTCYLSLSRFAVSVSLQTLLSWMLPLVAVHAPWQPVALALQRAPSSTRQHLAPHSLYHQLALITPDSSHSPYHQIALISTQPLTA